MTLSEAEAACVTGSPLWRGRTAGHLWRIREALGFGYTFPAACAKVMAEPLRAKALQDAATYGSPIPVDLTTLTGP